MAGEMLRCQHPEDLWHYLPKVGLAEDAGHVQGDITRAVKALEDAGHMVRDKNVFKSFPPGGKLEGSEVQVYSPLVQICDVLWKMELVNGRKASCSLEQKPFSYAKAETPGGNFKVDGYLRLRKSTIPTYEGRKEEDLPLADMATLEEYKLGESNDGIHNNRLKLLSASTFCMNDDPRRMHVYGITIEGPIMTVWYFSRSHSAMGTKFDFTKNPRLYIKIMLSLLFATEVELGYDPDVQRRFDPSKKQLCYVYRNQERYFKSESSIFEHRSLCITGRATRVWAVTEVNSFDDLRPKKGACAAPMVLKDVWLDANAPTEGDNLDAIFKKLEEIAQSLRETGPEPEPFRTMARNGNVTPDFADELKNCLVAEDFKKYFLTKDCQWRGHTSKDVAPEARPDATLFVKEARSVKAPSVPRSEPARASGSHHPTDMVSVTRSTLRRRYQPKRQYRVVFKEVCTALHDVRKLDDVLTTLYDCQFALSLMFVAGWIHRDISSGNLLAFEDESGAIRGKLADLEYAKLFRPEDAKGHSDPKTGTAFFMAVEIQGQVLLWNPPNQPKKLDQIPKLRKNRELAPQLSKPRIPVIHNYAHDLESIFWVLLWTLLARFPTARSGQDQVDFLSALDSVFRNTDTFPTTRQNILKFDYELNHILKWLDTRIVRLSVYLEDLRSTLRAAYEELPRDFRNLDTYCSLYQLVRLSLNDCKEELRQVGELPFLGSSHKAPERGKRPRSNADITESPPSKKMNIHKEENSTDL